MQVAIDGPSAAGKSTIAKAVAKKIGFVYCDTGAMYRATALSAMQHSLKLTDESKITKLLKHLQIIFKPSPKRQLVFIHDTHGKKDNLQNVTTKIRSELVTNNVSTVAALPQVRKILTVRQREIAQKNNVIMDGRDIGTTVLPHAQAKIFLTATALERAKRRVKDNASMGIHTPLATLEQEIQTRDYKDSHRKVSPLKQASDAVRVDTTHLNIPQVIKKVIQIISSKK